LEVILDTSFLLELVSKPIKRLDELEVELGKVEFIVLEPTVRELKRLASKPGVKAKKANAALNYVKNLKVVNLGDKKLKADSAILYYALKYRAAVATLDQELRDKLREEDVIVITLREDGVWVDR
jgi:rRNA-processing protein FCF1